jgi:hypothetical protein
LYKVHLSCKGIVKQISIKYFLPCSGDKLCVML